MNAAATAALGDMPICLTGFAWARVGVNAGDCTLSARCDLYVISYPMSLICHRGNANKQSAAHVRIVGTVWRHGAGEVVTVIAGALLELPTPRSIPTELMWSWWWPIFMSIRPPARCYVGHTIPEKSVPFSSCRKYLS